MFDPKKFTVTKPKPLPVLLLLDVSGSMGEIIDDRGIIDTGRTEFVDGKLYRVVEGGTARIQILNECCRKMIDTFVAEARSEIEVECAIITFGQAVRLHFPLTPVTAINWEDMEADGDTPMGEAFRFAKQMIEDKNMIPSRAYRPAVILVSDGCPTDSWQQPLQSFISEGRSSKCDRMALGISDKADLHVLESFVEGTNNPVFSAEDADKIHEFFKFVTMSVRVRTQSTNPNTIPILTQSQEKTSRSQPSKTTSDEDYF